MVERKICFVRINVLFLICDNIFFFSTILIENLSFSFHFLNKTRRYFYNCHKKKRIRFFSSFGKFDDLSESTMALKNKN